MDKLTRAEKGINTIAKCMGELLKLSCEGKKYEELSCDEFKSRYSDWKQRELQCLCRLNEDIGNIDDN
mgnify:FL=1